MHDLCSPPAGLCGYFGRVTFEAIVAIFAIPLLLAACVRLGLLRAQFALIICSAALIGWQQLLELVPTGPPPPILDEDTSIRDYRNASFPRPPTICEKLVKPLDALPLRAPQRVHSMLWSQLQGKDIVEIGAHSGDGMMCYARGARSAIAVEPDQKYCKKLAERASESNYFKAVCASYNSIQDADIYLWWQQQPHMPNKQVLEHLAEMQRQRMVRKNATAIVLFDHKVPSDMSDWRRYHKLAKWSQRVAFDERPAHQTCPHSEKDADRRLCYRAHGVFTVAAITISRMVATHGDMARQRRDITISRDS